MTAIKIDLDPWFIAKSTDISGSKIQGVNIPGAKVFLTDNATWKIVDEDLKVVAFKNPPVA